MALSTLWSLLFISFIVLSKSQNNETIFCPSSNWKSCGSKGKTCTIPHDITQGTISYGGRIPDNAPHGQWVFVPITNYRNGTFTIECSNDNFGSVYNNGDAKQGCCYINNIQGPSINDNSWNILALAPKQKFITNNIQYIRYGAFDNNGGRFIYRWMMGEFVCTSSWFGNIGLWKNSEPFCSTIPTLLNTQLITNTFTQCGSTKSNKCSLDITGNTGNHESIRLVQFGEYPNYVHRYLYSTDTNAQIKDSVPCNTALFGKPNENSGNEICSASNNTVFNGGATGIWKVISIQSNTIQYGVTSDNVVATSLPWQYGVNQTIASGVRFKVDTDLVYDLSVTTSTNVSNTVNKSYSLYKNKTNLCGIDCDVNMPNMKIYQWMFKLGEFIGVDLQSFDIYACNYVCSTSSTPPQCPPGFCKANTSCTHCISF